MQTALRRKTETGNEKDPSAALGMTKRGNVSSHFFSFHCEPTSAPSGHLLPEEGGRMPFSALSFRAKARNLFRSQSSKKREGSGEREAPSSMRLGRMVLHADSITKENGNGKRKRSLGCARDDETGKRLFPFFSFRCEPTSAPSGRLLPEEGGRMPASPIANPFPVSSSRNLPLFCGTI